MGPVHDGELVCHAARSGDVGRTFLPGEDQHGGGRVVILDYGFVIHRFGGDPNIIGKAITLDSHPWLVIGVMPKDFRPLGATNVSIYTPLKTRCGSSNPRSPKRKR